MHNNFRIFIIIIWHSINLHAVPLSTGSEETCGSLVIQTLDSDFKLVIQEGLKIPQKWLLNITGKLSGGFVNVQPGCRVDICGVSDNAWTDGDLAQCDSFWKPTIKLSEEHANKWHYLTSLSCACTKNRAGCESSTCIADHLQEDECALLYQEFKCQSCYYNPVRLKSGSTFRTDKSAVVKSRVVRKGCQVTMRTHGIVPLNTPRDFMFTDNAIYMDPAWSASIEEFSCSCESKSHPRTTSSTKSTLSTETILTKTEGPSNITFLEIPPSAKFSNKTETGTKGVHVWFSICGAIGVVLLFLIAVFLIHRRRTCVVGADDNPGVNCEDLDITPPLLANETQDPSPPTLTEEIIEPNTPLIEEVSDLNQRILSEELVNLNPEALVEENADPTQPVLTEEAIIVASPSTLVEEVIEEIQPENINDGAGCSHPRNWIRMSTLSEDRLREWDLPYDPKFEIRRNRFIIDVRTILGEGNYGIVYKGTLETGPKDVCIDVAIKTLKPCTSIEYIKPLLNEIKVISYIGHHHHPNIVCFLAACTMNRDNGDIYMIMEYCDKGNLRKYLKRIKPSSYRVIRQQGNAIKLDLIGPIINQMDNELLQQLLQWSRQIAAGMRYLCHRNVVHIDLAARNVFLTKDLIAKIGDFGLSRKLYSEPKYQKKGLDAVPLRWIAPESIRNEEYSPKSDVWAFGVVLFEIFSFGEKPYGIKSSMEILSMLRRGQRLSQPKYATRNIYNQMRKCWEEESESRPTFLELEKFFTDFSSLDDDGYFINLLFNED